MEIDKKIDEIGKAFHDFKKVNDERLAEIEKKGSVDTLVTEQTEKLNARISELENEVKKAKTAQNRKASEEAVMEKAEQKAAQNAEYKEAFKMYIKRGVEQKALSVASDPDGGFLVTPEMSAEIVKKIHESSPMRQLASVQPISSDSLEIIQDLEQMGSGWVGETAARPETTTAQLKKVAIYAHEMYAMPKASQKLLDDAFLNVEAWLAEHIAMELSRVEETAFVAGDGFNKPKGIISYASGTSFDQLERVASGASLAISADGLFNLLYALKEPYRANASFMMQRDTVLAVRKLKGSDNNYLWAPGLAASQPSTLLGRPVYEAADMEADGSSGNDAVACGDFRKGYQIVDRVGIRTLRDPYSSKPHILFYTTKRTGGGVKDFEAIKLMSIDS